MRTRALPVVALPAALLLMSGCQRLNDERTVSVPLGTVHTIEYTAPRYEQKVTVQISSPGAPVTVYLVKKGDMEAAQNRLDRNQAPESPLASKEKSEECTLEATVPAKTAFVLLIRPDKKNAEVKVKVTGR